MEYINPIWFYLMDTTNTLQAIAGIIAGFLIVVVVTLAMKFHETGEEEVARAIKNALIIIAICAAIIIVVPGKTVVCEMMLSQHVPAEDLINQDANKFIEEMEKYIEDIVNK